MAGIVARGVTAVGEGPPYNGDDACPPRGPRPLRHGERSPPPLPRLGRGRAGPPCPSQRRRPRPLLAPRRPAPPASRPRPGPRLARPRALGLAPAAGVRLGGPRGR